MAFIKLSIDTDIREVSLTVRSDLDRVLRNLEDAAPEIAAAFAMFGAASTRNTEPTGFSFVDAAARRREEAERADGLRRGAYRVDDLLARDDG